MAIMAKTTPVMMIPILAPDVILMLVSSKRSGRVSIADGRAVRINATRVTEGKPSQNTDKTYHERARKRRQRRDRFQGGI